ncbi:hypothetical protein K443DRAFT_297773 [Laccaria amethystina LaAM-08-1]|uniref:Uncharacterized protein n=1 Tax=Laccaria amethystina LaAM-08-1 TaxID=1095629 RepID=A0A0C9WUR6_9AGAR|nr:hypothetical protein K443DRAFT_297773 [Laccaria amethystina LaAM-08-1]
MPSVSVVATSTHYAGRTAVRPSHYPPSILWNMQDTSHIVFTPKNPSRIPMLFALRHEDGGLVDIEHYKEIRASGQALVKNMLFKSIPKDRAYQYRPHTKKFFMDVCRDTWNKAVHQYETEHPLLKLCAGYWKAEHGGYSAVTTTVSLAPS